MDDSKYNIMLIDDAVLALLSVFEFENRRA